jgi:tight adherence protein B
LAVLNRGYLAPYDSAVGQLVLLLVSGLFAAAFWWLARMTRPASVERFLVGSGHQAIPAAATGVHK